MCVLKWLNMMGLTLLQLTASHCRELEFAFKKRKLVCMCCSIQHVAHRKNTDDYVVTKCVQIFIVVNRIGDEASISYAAEAQETTKPHDSSSYPC